MLIKIATLILTLITSACTTRMGDKLGVQEGFQSYVPAKIAVLPCRAWPSRTQLIDTPVLDTNGVKEICKQYNIFVLNGFSNQPYMKGYSPKAINMLLEKANSSPSKIDNLFNWERPEAPCDECQTAGNYYKEHIAPQENWLKKLKNFSQMTRTTDAVLIPFVTSCTNRRHADRGYFFAERRAEVSLLLIDSMTGRLIWIGTRRTLLSNHRDSKKASSLAFPKWSQISDKLLTDQLWQDFPGRLIP